MGFHYSGSKFNILDLSPDFGSIILATLLNGIETTVGYMAPHMVGIMTPNVSKHIFWGFINLCFLIKGTSRIS